MRRNRQNAMGNPIQVGRIMAEIIDGKQVAESVVATVKQAAASLAANGVTPGLAVVIVGEDPASQVYVASKSRMAKECGCRGIAPPEHTVNLSRMLAAAKGQYRITIFATKLTD